MALNIKNPDVEADARWLARRRRQGITEVVKTALRREVEREKRMPRREDAADFHRRIQAIVEEFNRLPVLDNRSPDEIIGYNDQGLFD
jgi:antitoxin VapB